MLPFLIPLCPDIVDLGVSLRSRLAVGNDAQAVTLSVASSDAALTGHAQDPSFMQQEQYEVQGWSCKVFLSVHRAS